MPSPIRLVEFTSALARSVPATPRPRIAVANSGGPDSACLLFLLRQVFPPSALLSVHVLHNLQPASSPMAAAAAANARLTGVPHHAVSIPWGSPPFPPVPAPGPMERTARDARYHLLFHAVRRARVPFLALGHHADDQLETAIMRLASGSSLMGAAGMRPVRRWGMGSSHSPLAWFAHAGLNTFVLRPLLPFPKDRILATCAAHQLHYINDPTNSQPHLTLRNTIRHCLHHVPPFTRTVSLPPSPSLCFSKVKHAASSLYLFSPDVGSHKHRLYSAVMNLGTAARCVDRKVTSHLADHTPPSPTGTLLLPSLDLLAITDPHVRSALVMRVMRYVSFHPWGSLSADAHRRHSSIHRVVRALWCPDPRASQLKRFTAGAGVLWTPAIFNPNKPLRVGNQCLRVTLDHSDRFCWLASRTPPFSKNPQQGAGSPSRLAIDLTQQLRSTMSSYMPTIPLEILYDCRFLLRINPLEMPIHVKSLLHTPNETTSIKVLPSTQYYWPKIVLQRESHPDEVLAVPEGNESVRSPSWISISWVRPLDAA